MTDDNLIYFRNGSRVRKATRALMRGIGRDNAIVLVNPKYPHNVGGTVRMAACYGIGEVWITGDRVPIDDSDFRLPREERMRSYQDVTLIAGVARPLEWIRLGITPVAVEFTDNAESLIDFVHPQKAVYVFGPEDGGLDKAYRSCCHQFVRIPSRHCLNLAAAVGTVLYDRLAKETKT